MARSSPAIASKRWNRTGLRSKIGSSHGNSRRTGYSVGEGRVALIVAYVLWAVIGSCEFAGSKARDIESLHWLGDE